MSGAESRSSDGPATRLDPSFAGKGFLLNREIGGFRVAEDARGRLLVAGGANGELVAARYLPDGGLDRSFGASGLARVSLPGFGPEPAAVLGVGAIAIQADGKILLGGSFGSGLGARSSAVLARLNPNGSLDSEFGGSRIQGGLPGRVILTERNAIEAITLQGKKIVVAGTSGRGFVGRFNPDGSLDRSFGGGRLGGWSTLPRPPEGKSRYNVDAGVEGLIAASRGKLYAAGYANGNFMLARLRYDGLLDRGFGAGGVVRVEAAARRACRCSRGEGLASDRRGRLLVSGSVLSRHRGAPRAVAVARFRQDGALDRSFGQDGIARRRVETVTSGGPFAIGPDGRIIVAGSAARGDNAPNRLTLVAFEPNGRPDRSFFGDGVFKAGFGAFSSRANNLLIDRLGRVVVAGNVLLGPNRRKLQGAALLARLAPVKYRSK